MKLTVNKYLNARIGSASTGAACQFYRSPGDTITIDQIIMGDELDGNSVWYHCSDDGCYYWSGGIEETTFEITGTDYYQQLSDRELMTILGEAKNYFWNLFIKTMPELTGMYIGDKTTGGAVALENYALVFQVLQKSNSSGNPIPPVLHYKGLTIKTDVTSAQTAVLQQAKPGDSIARTNGLSHWGTLSIKVSRKEEEGLFFYLLTNYHVAAYDLVAAGVYDFDLTAVNISDRSIVSSPQSNTLNGQTEIGAVSDGVLNATLDAALVLMNDGADAANTTGNATAIDKTPLDVQGTSQYKNSQVTLYGAKSMIQPSTITSVNSSQIFSYNNGNLFIRLHNLIQLQQCSQPGDSGSPILLGNKIIGILVGADDTSSYVIPITGILKYFNIKIS
ncbi:MAG: hypothetical protein JST86_09855 [Bacteroidetes bacterium]|nr:hypothetical protein [Bacteroidota bacterium]